MGDRPGGGWWFVVRDPEGNLVDAREATPAEVANLTAPEPAPQPTVEELAERIAALQAQIDAISA